MTRFIDICPDCDERDLAAEPRPAWVPPVDEWQGWREVPATEYDLLTGTTEASETQCMWCLRHHVGAYMTYRIDSI